MVSVITTDCFLCEVRAGEFYIVHDRWWSWNFDILQISFGSFHVYVSEVFHFEVCYYDTDRCYNVLKYTVLYTKIIHKFNI